mmetsp:Transcript_20891/g.50943  ORF Transcript_20891/g.50943 Transcript_20891/m.50943 type:complete len:228 (-) Transcript_20891:304-987(-)
MPYSRRRAYVMTLPEAEGEPARYSRFRKEWATAYPELDIVRITTFRSQKRGLGILASSICAVDRAMQDNVDVAMIFEDDAMPFKPLNQDSWKTQFDLLLMRWPNNSLILFLGAHHIVPHLPRGQKLSRTPKLLDPGIVHIKYAFGAYSYVVRKTHLPCLSKYLRDLAAVDAKAYNHDVDWWRMLFRTHTPAYVAAPLLVDHRAGFSMTWLRNRSDAWMGKREWWNRM